MRAIIRPGSQEAKKQDTEYRRQDTVAKELITDRKKAEKLKAESKKAGKPGS